MPELILLNEGGNTLARPLDHEQQMVTEWKKKRLLKQQYRLIGNHSVVKICQHCKEDIRGDGGCYKNTFYGIETVNCLEMSPAVTCNQRCKHCWRDTSVFSKGWIGPVDDPKFIVEGCLQGRERLLIGFYGNDRVDRERLRRSIEQPTHAAISLTGEPCMYPRLPELVEEFFNHSFTSVFLVTSGTVPETLQKFFHSRPPTNIYLSMETTNEPDYIRFCVPVIDNAWQKILQSMDILRELNKTKAVRTVMRITCTKGYNMDQAKEFIQYIERMQPDVVECKGYMWVGYSQLRLKKENMPWFDEVLAFAKEIEASSSYRIMNWVEKSTVVMLAREGYGNVYQREEKVNGVKSD